MKIEIERKFLLASDRWRTLVQRSEIIQDGLVSMTEERKTRVRIMGGRATLTVKTRRIEGRRFEFEYDIPLADAELMLGSCGNNVLVKRRHYVPLGGLTWEIDEYEGPLRGVVMAEIELDDFHQPFEIPDWIGREVTAEESYRKHVMLRERLNTSGGSGAA